MTSTRTGSSKSKEKRLDEHNHQEKRAKKNNDDIPLIKHPKIKERYSTTFCSRNIIFGKVINFTEMQSIHFEDIFSKLGWNSFISLNLPMYPRLVRAFYASIVPMEDKLGLECTLKNKTISFDVATLNHILGVPNKGIVFDPCELDLEDFSLSNACSRICINQSFHLKPQSKDLTIQAKVIHHFLTFNIVPRGGNRCTLTQFDLYLLDNIFKGCFINLGALIINHMKHAIKTYKKQVITLPYGMLLTKIFQYFNVHLESENDVYKPTLNDTYNHVSLNRMGFHVQNGVWISKNDPMAPPRDVDRAMEVGGGDDHMLGEEEDTPLRAHSSSSFNIEKAFNRLFTLMDQRFNTIDGQLASLNTNLNTMNAQHQTMWEYFQHFGPSPP
uniref:Putative plant transposon protein domain-containing protein n=1 Tax=Cannabis sativa TaxID=3483 RepID=A0A803NGQ9_CANSA